MAKRIAKFHKVSFEQFQEGYIDSFGPEEEEKIRKIYDAVRLPKRATAGSAGYDFYAPLLKDRHREIFEQYILNDLSLSEIAQKYDITRQGVYDIVKRGSRKLEEYEEKLQLFQRFQMAKERLGKIEELIKTDRNAEKEELLALAREIYDIL